MDVWIFTLLIIGTWELCKFIFPKFLDPMFDKIFKKKKEPVYTIYTSVSTKGEVYDATGPIRK